MLEITIIYPVDKNFTEICNQCGAEQPVSYEYWEGAERYDVHDHFICIACLTGLKEKTYGQTEN